MVFALAVALVGVARSSPAAAANNGLPPSGYRALEKLYRADVRPLGLVITRAMLESTDTYERDPDGTHLALYVAPRRSNYSDADYVRNFATLTSRFVPKVFKQWKGLVSFDICQEPVDDVRAEPPPVTQVFVTRDALDRVGNWRKATLTELIAAAPRVRTGADYYVYFDSSVQDDPTLQAATRAAGVDTATTTSAPRAG